MSRLGLGLRSKRHLILSILVWNCATCHQEWAYVSLTITVSLFQWLDWSKPLDRFEILSIMVELLLTMEI